MKNLLITLMLIFVFSPLYAVEPEVGMFAQNTSTSTSEPDFSLEENHIGMRFAVVHNIDPRMGPPHLGWHVGGEVLMAATEGVGIFLRLVLDDNWSFSGGIGKYATSKAKAFVNVAGVPVLSAGNHPSDVGRWVEVRRALHSNNEQLPDALWLRVMRVDHNYQFFGRRKTGEECIKYEWHECVETKPVYGNARRTVNTTNEVLMIGLTWQF